MGDMKLGSFTDSGSGFAGYFQKQKALTATTDDQLGISIVADDLKLKTTRGDDGQVFFRSKEDALKVLQAGRAEVGRHDFGIFENPDGTFSIGKVHEDIKPNEVSSYKPDAQKGSAPVMVALFTDEDHQEHAVAAPPPAPPEPAPKKDKSLLGRITGQHLEATNTD